MTLYRNEHGTEIELPDDQLSGLDGAWSNVATDGSVNPQPAPSPEPASEPEDHADAVAGDEPPPKSGKGSSDANWTAYARSQGVDVTDDMSRKDVIAACENAGVRVS